MPKLHNVRKSLELAFQQFKLQAIDMQPSSCNAAIACQMIIASEFVQFHITWSQQCKSQNFQGQELRIHCAIQEGGSVHVLIGRSCWHQRGLD